MSPLGAFYGLPDDCLRVMASFICPKQLINEITNVSVRDPDQFHAFLWRNKLTCSRLYDILSTVETLGLLRFPDISIATVSEIKQQVELRLKEEHAEKMRINLAYIPTRRIPATHCSGGCIMCGSTLPLNWPELGLTPFCNDVCRSDFCSREMLPAEKYTCMYDRCQASIPWADLEARGGYTFCCDACEYIQCEIWADEEYEMRKYDWIERGR